MSESTDRARRILEGSPTPAGKLIPQDYDLRVAECFAAIAQAEALERLADVLESCIGSEGVSTLTGKDLAPVLHVAAHVL